MCSIDHSRLSRCFDWLALTAVIFTIVVIIALSRFLVFAAAVRSLSKGSRRLGLDLEAEEARAREAEEAKV